MSAAFLAKQAAAIAGSYIAPTALSTLQYTVPTTLAGIGTLAASTTLKRKRTSSTLAKNKMGKHWDSMDRQWGTKKPLIKKGKTMVRILNPYGGILASMRKDKKYHDKSFTAVAIGNTGTLPIDSLNAMVQGLTAVTRIGKTVYPISIHLKMTLELPSSANNTEGSDIIRIIVYEDKQANKLAVQAITDLLESAAYDSFRNLAQIKRFKFLRDKSFTLNALSVANPNPVQRVVNWNIMLKKPCRLEYVGNAGTVADMASCNFGVMAITKGGFIKLKIHSRFRYTD